MKTISTISKLIAAIPGAMLLVGAGAADFDYQITGNAADARTPHTEGALLLRGGGGPVDDAFRWFVMKAGGGDILLLKASDGKPAAPDTFGAYLHDTIGGCDSVEVITFRSREAASDPHVLQVIKKAEGIFLGGGKQFLYADYWKGTPVAAALDEHVRRGRPLGGSSAGLAVLGQHCYTAHVTARLTSEMALSNPFDKAVTLEHDFFHFDLMRGVITDSHFSSRDRLGRLIAFVSRIAAESGPENLLGIGIDEKSALCVEANGSARVLSSSPEGCAWLVLPRVIPKICQPGQPLTCENVRIITAGPESGIDFSRRSVTQPVRDTTASVESGALSLKP